MTFDVNIVACVALRTGMAPPQVFWPSSSAIISAAYRSSADTFPATATVLKTTGNGHSYATTQRALSAFSHQAAAASSLFKGTGGPGGGGGESVHLPSSGGVSPSAVPLAYIAP